MRCGSAEISPFNILETENRDRYLGYTFFAGVDFAGQCQSRHLWDEATAAEPEPDPEPLIDFFDVIISQFVSMEAKF
jgi:hypothetical protein